MDWLQGKGYIAMCMVYSTGTCWVYRGKHPGCPNCTPEVAIKIQSFPSEQALMQAYREIENQGQLQHNPSVVHLFEYFYEYIPNNKVLLFLVMEWVEKDLMKDVEQRRVNHFPWNESELDTIACDLIRVLARAQELGICHRDIKPQNIFYDPIRKSVKLGDFGSSAAGIISGVQDASIVGTIMCMSEELKMAAVTGLHRISHDVVKSDVYALGITLLILAKLTVPHSIGLQLGNQAVMLWTEISALLYSDRIKKMIWNMLNPCVEERYTFTQLEGEYCPAVVVAVSRALPSDLPYQQLGQYTAQSQTLGIPQHLVDPRTVNQQPDYSGTLQEPSPQYSAQYPQEYYHSPAGDVSQVPGLQSGNSGQEPACSYYQDSSCPGQYSQSVEQSAPLADYTVNQQFDCSHAFQEPSPQCSEQYPPQYYQPLPVEGYQESSQQIANGCDYSSYVPQSLAPQPGSVDIIAQNSNPAALYSQAQSKPCRTSVAFTQDIVKQQLMSQQSLGKGRKSSFHESSQDAGSKSQCALCKMAIQAQDGYNQPVFLSCKQCSYLPFCNRGCFVAYVESVTFEYALPYVMCQSCKFPLEEKEINRHFGAGRLLREKVEAAKRGLQCVDCRANIATLSLNTCHHIYCEGCISSITRENRYVCSNCNQESSKYEHINKKSWF